MSNDITKNLGELGGLVSVSGNTTSFSGPITTTTPAQFDNSTSVPTTAFVKKTLGNRSSTILCSSNLTLTAAQVGAYIEIIGGGGYTIYLPDISTLTPGSSFLFCNNSSSNCAIAGFTLQNIIVALSSSATLTIGSGGSIELITDGSSWSSVSGTHITPSQFNNSELVATTKFVQNKGIHLNGMILLPTDGVITASGMGKCWVADSTIGRTVGYLPEDSSITEGSTITVMGSNGSGTFTVYPPAGRYFAYGSSNIGVNNPLTFNFSDSVTFGYSSGCYYVLMGGTTGLDPKFKVQKAATGYQILPSGLILQWGQAVGSSTVDVVTGVTIPFPNVFLQVTLTQAYTASSGSIGYASGSPTTNQTFTWRASNTGNGYYYLAIGY